MACFARILLGVAFLACVLCKDPEEKDGAGHSENAQEARPEKLAQTQDIAVAENGLETVTNTTKTADVVNVKLSSELQTLLQENKGVVRSTPDALWPMMSRHLRGQVAIARARSASPPAALSFSESAADSASATS
mmetsp:Transcript_139057/g.387887  ORF Transcript_139057/g.387887 Transcript_139057/m.387887 type:complete len:135 (-) Transcript_139057:242-646(-)